MATLKEAARKLKLAILSKGLVITMGSSEFYSDQQKRFVQVYTLSTPVWYTNKAGDFKRMSYEIIRSASLVDIVECLKEIWEQTRLWQ